MMQLIVILSDIFALYDPSLSFSNAQSQQQISKLVSAFFKKHDYQERLYSMQVVAKKSLDCGSCGLIISWFLEWSRKKYCQIVQRQRNLFKRSRGTEPTFLSQETRSKRVLNNKQMQFKEQPQKNLNLFSRAIVHGYFLKQLKEYYRFVGMEDLDRNYMRDLRQRGKCEDLLLEQNLKQAVNVLKNTKENKLIEEQMQKYHEEYSSVYRNQRVKPCPNYNICTKFPDRKGLKTEPNSNRGPINTQKDEPNIESFGKYKKIGSFQPQGLGKTPDRLLIQQNLQQFKSIYRPSNLKLPRLSRYVDFEQSIQKLQSSNIPKKNICLVRTEPDETRPSPMQKSSEIMKQRNYIQYHRHTKKVKTNLDTSYKLILVGNKSVQNIEVTDPSKSIDVRELRDAKKRDKVKKYLQVMEKY